jgi:hypothetical protein
MCAGRGARAGREGARGRDDAPRGEGEPARRGRRPRGEGAPASGRAYAAARLVCSTRRDEARTKALTTAGSNCVPA